MTAFTLIVLQAASEWLYVVPWGIGEAVNYITKRYGKPPIYITENGNCLLCHMGASNGCRVRVAPVSMLVLLRQHIRLDGHIDGTTPAPPKCIDREVKMTVVADQGAGTSAASEIRFEYETLTENNPEYEVWLAHD
ncbi:hypothetical protein EJ110_NYTH59155 [Nymphaea thermarum]|nr:hypothetical protein EJ110_NYTH59155 [Nymphaea thermarum]